MERRRRANCLRSAESEWHSPTAPPSQAYARVRWRREVAALESVSAVAQRSLPSRAADNLEPCMRFLSARPARLPRSLRTRTSALVCAVAQLHPPPWGRRHAQSTPPCGNFEGSCGEHPASTTLVQRD